MSDLLIAGDQRTPRRWPLRLVLGVAVAIATGIAVIPGVVDERLERRTAAQLQLTGDPVGSGSRADGTVVVSYVLVNLGPLPVRLLELRLQQGAFDAVRVLSELDDPLPAGGSRQVEMALRSTRCPDAVQEAQGTQLTVLAETADGKRRSVLLQRSPGDESRDSPLVQAARLACDRPSPAQAAQPILVQLKIVGDEAVAVLALRPRQAVSVLRLLPDVGLDWSTSVRLPAFAQEGTELLLPVRARRGNCSGAAHTTGQGSLGIEVALEDDPTDLYFEPPEVTFITPSDLERPDQPLGVLGALRDRLCGVTRE